MDVEIHPFDPRSASREEWDRFHAFRRLRHREVNPDDPDWEDASVEGWMTRSDPQEEEVRYLAFDSARQEVLGDLTFTVVRPGAPSFEEKKREAHVEVSVLEPHRRKGLGARLLQRALDLAREHGRTLLVGNTQEEDGVACLRHLGAHFARTSRESRLRLDEVDWDMVEAWAAAGPRRSPDTDLLWFGNRLDDPYLEPYADLFTEVWNDAPRDELATGDLTFTAETIRAWEARFDATGGTALLAVTREPDGELSGLTEMGYWPERTWIIQQFLTGVRRRHRGRGLGKWLKAAMLLRVRDELPQVKVVTTSNATTNAAMLSINERLGFRLHREWESVQMERAGLEKRLGDGNP